MKVGSLVECVDASPGRNTGEVFLVLGKIYTVTGFHSYYEDEIFVDDQPKSCFMSRFREIQFPPSLEAEIENCLTREFQER